MKAIAVFPGQANSVHLADLPMPSLDEVPNGRGVLVRVLRCSGAVRPPRRWNELGARRDWLSEHTVRLRK